MSDLPPPSFPPAPPPGPLPPPGGMAPGPWAAPQPGPWGAPPPGAAPQPPAGTGGSSRVPLLLGVTAGAVAVVAGGLWLMQDDSPHPAEWDERVVDLVDFDHPVHVDFLTADEYTARTRGDAGELTEQEEAEVARVEGTMRALGLVQGDFDLLESTGDLVDTGTLAFYDLQAERVVVRGTEVTPRLAATLVHELTHVLQHQAFPATELLIEPGDATSGALLAMRGLIEGDADRIERAYVDSLPPDEQAEIEEVDEEGLADLDEEGIPEALLATFGLPYALGEGFVTALDAEGRLAIDRAFHDPPTTEEHLLVPSTFLDRDQAHVVSASAPDGAEVLEEGDFGAASLMLVLGSRIPAHDALQAAIGWGGDDYVTYEDDDRVCISLVVSSDTAEDAVELLAAVTAWVEAGPADAATTRLDGDDVVLDACDPGGEEATAPPEASPMATLTLAALRSIFVADAIAGGAPQDVADCYADGVVGSFTVDEVTADEPPADVQARVDAAAARCR